MIRRLPRLAALLGLTAVLGLAACHTVEGAGTDIKKTGAVIEKTADKAAPK